MRCEEFKSPCLVSRGILCGDSKELTGQLDQLFPVQEAVGFHRTALIIKRKFKDGNKKLGLTYEIVISNYNLILEEMTSAMRDRRSSTITELKNRDHLKKGGKGL